MRVNSQAVCEIEEKRRYLLGFLGFCGGGASLKQHNPPPQPPPLLPPKFRLIFVSDFRGWTIFLCSEFWEEKRKKWGVVV